MLIKHGFLVCCVLSRPKEVKAKLRIPQTAIFRDGVLKSWYFTGAGGTIRRKGKKCLEKSILLREFIKEAKPGASC